MSVDQLSPTGKKTRVQEFTAADTNVGGDWKTMPIGIVGNYYDVEYGNGTFVAVGLSGTDSVIASSTDGCSWTLRLTASGAGGFSTIAYSPSLALWVAGGNITGSDHNLTYTSPDAITWTQRNTMPSSTKWVDICWHVDKFIAVAGGGFTSTAAAISTNGTSWTAKTLPVTGFWSRIASDGSTRAVICAGGWLGSPNSQLGSVVTTDDGLTYTQRSTGATAGSKYWASIAYGNGYWVMIATTSDNMLAYSTDAVTWSGNAMPATMSFTSVAYGNGTFVIQPSGFPTGQPALTSVYRTTTPNTGVVTQRMMHNLTQTVSACTYGNGKFVAVGSGGLFYVSQVATNTWTCPPGVYSAEILAVAGAAGAGSSNSGTVGCGGGGAAGQVVKKRVAVTPGVTYTSSLGLGGVGCLPGATGSHVATAGGDTTFGVSGSSPLVIAYGGQPGAQFGQDAVAGNGPGGGGGGAAAAVSAGGGGAGAAGPGENPFYTGSAVVTGKVGALPLVSGFPGGNGATASSGFGKGGPGLYGYGKGGNGGGPISPPGQSTAGSSAGISGALNSGNGGNGGLVGTGGAGGWGGTGYLSITWEQ